MDTFLEDGFNVFIDLTHPNEMPPYADILMEQAKAYDLEVQLYSFPIGDFGLQIEGYVPPPGTNAKGDWQIATDGYNALQVGFGARKAQRVNKAARGHMAKAGKDAFEVLKEFRLDDVSPYEVGQAIKVGDLFKAGDRIDVSGISKGHGFAGVIKRWSFGGFPGSHGTHEYFRHGGSIGNRSFPGRVRKGKKMAGHMGARRVTVQNLEVIGIDEERGLLLIYDEVQTGVGRTGRLFAHEWADAAPDIMAIAKGIGGGFPVGACLATEAAAQAMTPGTHGTTFGGNPLAMAVGNAVLDVILAPGFLPDVVKKGERLAKGVAQLVDKHQEVFVDFRGKGLMLGLKCVGSNTEMVERLRRCGLLTVGAGDNVVRLLRFGWPYMNELQRATAQAHLVSMLAAHGVDLDLAPLYRRRRPQEVAWDAGATVMGAGKDSRERRLATGFPLLRVSAELAGRLGPRLAAGPTAAADGWPPPQQLAQPEPVPDRGGIVEFRDVSFAYPGAEEPVLHDVSFTALPGQTTAFVGPTGSGKSTLIALIQRVYDVTSGQVLVDGVDVREMRQEELRAKIGYVSQRAVLFSGTIESNIQYGNERATATEIERAASRPAARIR